MPSDVKRIYSSPLRQAQARETRRLLVTAAANLFARDGYGATTIDAIAEVAGVSRKTVFSAGGKLELLKLGIDWAIAGDDEPVAMRDRPEIASLFTREDAAGIVADWLAIQIAIDARIAGLFAALRVAAGMDPEAREVLRANQDALREGCGYLARHLSGLDALRPDLTVDEAADLLALASDPVLWSRLVDGSGWTPGRFAQWLTATTTAQLLRPDPPSPLRV